MTAARYKYPAALTIAGKTFGLDLAKLFADEDTSKSGEGFLPQFAKPQEKTRGAVLGYKTSETSAPSVLSITPPAAAAPAAAKEEEIVKPKESLGSIAGKWGQSGLFGAQDYFKALEAGYKPDEIRSYIESNPFMVAETNRPGQTAGLYEQIIRNQVTKPGEFFTPQQYLEKQIANVSQSTQTAPAQTQASQTTSAATQPTTTTTTTQPTQTTSTTTQPVQTSSGTTQTAQTSTGGQGAGQQTTKTTFTIPKASEIIKGEVGKGEIGRLQEIAKSAGLSTKDVVSKAGVSDLSKPSEVKKVLEFIQSRAR